jgi:hypothetical protein
MTGFFWNIVYKESVRTSQKAQFISVIKAEQLMICSEILVFIVGTTYTNVLCGKMQSILIL